MRASPARTLVAAGYSSLSRNCDPTTWRDVRSFSEKSKTQAQKQRLRREDLARACMKNRRHAFALWVAITWQQAARSSLFFGVLFFGVVFFALVSVGLSVGPGAPAIFITVRRFAGFANILVIAGISDGAIAAG